MENQAPTGALSGCLKFLGICLLIGLIGGAWMGYQEWRSGEEQPARASGRVLLFGETFTASGISCNGAGEYQMIGRDTPITIGTGDDVLLSTVLSAGMVTDAGACEFTFFGDLDLHNTYQIAIGEDLNTVEATCGRGVVPVTSTDDGTSVLFQVQITDNGVECVQP